MYPFTILSFIFNQLFTIDQRVFYIEKKTLLINKVYEFILDIPSTIDKIIESRLVLENFLNKFLGQEKTRKYLETNPEDPTRYLAETVHKFESPVRVGIYIVSFVLLIFHLWHGFSSSFQSVGFNNIYSKSLIVFTKVYAVSIPLGFAQIHPQKQR